MENAYESAKRKTMLLYPNAKLSSICNHRLKKNKYWFIDSIIDGKRFKTMARYGKTSKEDALEKIKSKKQDKINELTIYFE